MKRNDVPYVFQCLLNIQLYATAIVYSDLWHNFRTAKGKLTQNIFISPEIFEGASIDSVMLFPEYERKR